MHYPLAPAGQTAVTAPASGNLRYWQAAAITLGATTVWALYAYGKLRTQHRRVGKELKRHQATRAALQGWLADV